jgi:hypothetical protein
MVEWGKGIPKEREMYKRREVFEVMSGRSEYTFHL